MLLFWLFYWRCFSRRKRGSRSLLPLYKNSHKNSSRPRSDWPHGFVSAREVQNITQKKVEQEDSLNHPWGWMGFLLTRVVTTHEGAFGFVLSDRDGISGVGCFRSVCCNTWIYLCTFVARMFLRGTTSFIDYCSPMNKVHIWIVLRRRTPAVMNRFLNRLW
jgi:hypothetical protein